ncbi:MAG TPA: hypothetical protein VFA75_01870 [Nevskia sp.]|nr:hypothetical protein [Nevskia sp.]
MSQLKAWELSEELKKDAGRLRDLYELMAVYLFEQYEPTLLPTDRISRKFLKRLDRWLDGFENEKQKWAAFRSIEYLLFIGSGEFFELYRAAHKIVLERWLIECSGIDIFAADADSCLKSEMATCWPCPVTDSFLINEFLRITGIPGHPFRPDWQVLKILGDKDKIARHVERHKLTRLVLLEDFSGSGGQISRVLKFAAEAFAGPILLIPLVVCADGDRLLKKSVQDLKRGNIAYKPVLVVERDCLVQQDATAGEPRLFAGLREAINGGYKKLGVELEGGAFGYGGVGSLVVMKGNCPNNTPPIYHFDGNGWMPPFPRHDRFRNRHVSV